MDQKLHQGKAGNIFGGKHSAPDEVSAISSEKNGAPNAMSAATKAFNEQMAEVLYDCAVDIAYAQMERTEHHMKTHPDEYRHYNEGKARLLAVENKVLHTEEGVVLTRKLMEEIFDAHYEQAVALAIEMYLRGVLDGGRICYAFVCRELPKKELIDNAKPANRV